MVDWLLHDDLGQWVLIIGGLGVLIGGEHLAKQSGRRFWMWAAGLAGIAILIWFKGADHAWTWLLAAGWLGVLAYADRKLTASSR